MLCRVQFITPIIGLRQRAEHRARRADHGVQRLKREHHGASAAVRKQLSEAIKRALARAFEIAVPRIQTAPDRHQTACADGGRLIHHAAVVIELCLPPAWVVGTHLPSDTITGDPHAGVANRPRSPLDADFA